MSTESIPLLHPKPRRPFDLTDSFTSHPRSENGSHSHFTVPDDGTVISDGSNAVNNPNFSRTRSILNLTSSTLLGIYSPTGYMGDRDDTAPSTPWGTGAQTPRGMTSIDSSLDPAEIVQTARPIPRRARSSQNLMVQPAASTEILNLAFRTILLFCLGMGYGVLVTHLHNERQLAPFHVQGIIKPSYNWPYLVFWGMSGVALGSLLPWIDTVWEQPKVILEEQASEDDEHVASVTGLSADWHPVVRSIGAFVGIAFAIRKLSWSSSLQVSLTLFLVNPVLWYLIDRSKPGFLLSATVGLLGTSTLLALNPEMMPTPVFHVSPSQVGSASNAIGSASNQVLGGLVSKGLVECGIWIVSVLFCSCVCFGNIGRRLALKRGLGRALGS